MKKTITNLLDPLDIPLHTRSQNDLNLEGYENDAWYPINFQWKSIYELKEYLNNELNVF